MKNVSRQQHDKNRYSRIATVDSCFALIGARQHCIAKMCNASPTANSHKLQRPVYYIKLVSRNVFHVVSAWQSLLLFHIFPADQVSCRSYVGSVYRMRSLAVFVTLFQLSSATLINWRGSLF